MLQLRLLTEVLNRKGGSKMNDRQKATEILNYVLLVCNVQNIHPKLYKEMTDEIEFMLTTS